MLIVSEFENIMNFFLYLLFLVLIGIGLMGNLKATRARTVSEHSKRRLKCIGGLAIINSILALIFFNEVITSRFPKESIDGWYGAAVGLVLAVILSSAGLGSILVTLYWHSDKESKKKVEPD